LLLPAFQQLRMLYGFSELFCSQVMVRAVGALPYLRARLPDAVGDAIAVVRTRMGLK
jgi:hypothetical protein